MSSENTADGESTVELHLLQPLPLLTLGHKVFFEETLGCRRRWAVRISPDVDAKSQVKEENGNCLSGGL